MKPYLLCLRICVGNTHAFVLLLVMAEAFPHRQRLSFSPIHRFRAVHQFTDKMSIFTNRAENSCAVASLNFQQKSDFVAEFQISILCIHIMYIWFMHTSKFQLQVRQEHQKVKLLCKENRQTHNNCMRMCLHHLPRCLNFMSQIGMNSESVTAKCMF